jgi:hypothetical protein
MQRTEQPPKFAIDYPIQVFSMEQPSFRHFQVFGSIAYPHIPEERRPKQSTWNALATDPPIFQAHQDNGGKPS